MQKGLISLIVLIIGIIIGILSIWIKNKKISFVVLIIGFLISFSSPYFESKAQVNTSKDWIKFSQKKLDKLIRNEKRVFIDFTAAWCITCQFNKKTVLDTKEIRDSFSRKNIILIQADWTNGDEEITKILKRFNRNGVPLYVLYNGKRGSKPIILPNILTKTIILDEINSLP